MTEDAVGDSSQLVAVEMKLLQVGVVCEDSEGDVLKVVVTQVDRRQRRKLLEEVSH